MRQGLLLLCEDAHTVQIESAADGGQGWAEVLDQVVITTTAANSGAGAGGKALESQAGVVGHAADFAQIEGDVRRQVHSGQARIDGLQALHCGGHVVGQADFQGQGQHLLAAAQVRQGLQGPPGGQRQRQGGEQGVQFALAFAVNGLAEALANVGRQVEGGQEAMVEADVADNQLEVAQARRLQRGAGQAEDFDIGGDGVGADQFEAGLTELAPAAGLRFFVAKDIADVEEAQRQRLIVELGAHGACRGDGQIGAQGQSLAIAVNEAHHVTGELCARRPRHHVGVFERGWDDFVIGPTHESGAQVRFQRALLRRLGQKQVADAIGDAGRQQGCAAGCRMVIVTRAGAAPRLYLK